MMWQVEAFMWTGFIALTSLFIVLTIACLYAMRPLVELLYDEVVRPSFHMSAGFAISMLKFDSRNLSDMPWTFKAGGETYVIRKKKDDN